MARKDKCPYCGAINETQDIPAGTVGGATAGAIIGSAVPVIGTTIGLIAGAIVGTLANTNKNPSLQGCKVCKRSWRI